jgi:uncharacterized cupin superfamily protein
MSVPNVFREHGLDGVSVQEREHPGFRTRRFRVGWALATEELGVSMFEVEPGEAAYPLHYHLGEEELLLVLDGTPSLRVPGRDWRRLEPGDVVSFPRGETGAHQLANFGDSRVRFLAVSTSGVPDVVVYPDSGKIAAAERRSTGVGLLSVHRLADAVDYYVGETPPERPASAEG